MPDLDGTELASLSSARKEAVILAGALIKEHGQSFWDSQEWHMEVTDESGILLFRLDFMATEGPVVSASEGLRRASSPGSSMAHALSQI
jgi:hypothetical protein